MSRPKIIRTLGVAVALAVVVAFGSAMTSGKHQPDTIVTTLTDADALEPGNDVRAAGVLVGSIKSIDLVDNKARVTLQVDPAVLPIHSDATIKVKPVNLLGEDYLDLDPGKASSPFLKDAVVPTSQTSTSVTLQDVLNTFHAPTAAALATVISNLGEGLHDNGGQLSQALARLAPAMKNTAALGTVLSRQNALLADLIRAADPIAAAVDTNGGRTMANLVSATRDTLVAVTAQESALKDTILQLPGTLVAAQRTLARFGGTAREATPTLTSIRPLTDNLSKVVAEIQQFADAADPALASLQPVLARANALLDQAAPVVAQLRQSGPDLQRATHSLRPVSASLLDKNLQGVMDFVRKWALSTNGQDGLSHYFRGVVYVTPSALKSLLRSLVPAGVNLGTTKAGTANPLGGLTQGLTGVTSGLTQTLNGLLGGILGPNTRTSSTTTSRQSTDQTSALGLSETQEHSLLSQLLGGDN